MDHPRPQLGETGRYDYKIPKHGVSKNKSQAITKNNNNKPPHHPTHHVQNDCSKILTKPNITMEQKNQPNNK